MTARNPRVDADEFDRRLSNLAVATADESDTRIDRAVKEVLCLVRDHLQMDVVFVSHFEEGRRVFRAVEQPAGAPLLKVGGSDPLSESYCQRVIYGQLPQLVTDMSRFAGVADLPRVTFPIGAHLSTPIVLLDGSVYGTLCCFSFAPNEALTQRDLGRLQMAARMTARLIDKSDERARREA